MNETVSTNVSENSRPSFNLTYNFSSAEIAILAKFLRNNQSSLPKGLESFEKAIEDSVYNSLSLEEVRNFYS
ncbi:MAG: hypothetical protein MJ188_07420 [Treponema sp.]|nr:hypothetical protein [Treponema sp.]